MSAEGLLTWDIESGPSGPEVGAFFDLDGTLVQGFSVGAFLRDRLFTGRMTLQDGLDVALSALAFRRGGLGFSGMMAAMARMLRGTSEAELRETSERIFREQMAALVFPDARGLVRAHLEAGHTLAVVSAATPYQVEPVARDLGIPNVLCTRLEVKSGRLTGRVLLPTCWGEGKLAAARAFARERGIDLAKSYFYTDGYEDLPLLDAVGFPRPTNADRPLARLARARAWSSRRLPGVEPPRLADLARTGLLVALAPDAALLALGAALASRRSRAPLDACVAGLGWLASALGGLELRVEGREHLREVRPALFLFNHASAIDALLVCRLLRRDFALLVPHAARVSPALRALAAVADALVVDEPETPADVETTARAVEELRREVSLVTAPEARLALSPRLAEFRTGPFAVAAAAGVPIVPIVIRNALEALPSNGVVLRKTAIDVRVLPPIATTGWTRRTLRREIARVRELFVAHTAET